MEILRSRDCLVLSKGDAYTTVVSEAMSLGGWIGGQGVQWTTPVNNEPKVDYSDGLYAGFVLWGSDEDADKFTAMTRQYPTYRYAVVGAGGWIISTRAFEKYTYLSRTGGGPLVPIVYSGSDRLVFSLRGFWTTEDEWSLSLDPRAPNNYYIGFVVQPPSPITSDFITIQVSI